MQSIKQLVLTVLFLAGAFTTSFAQSNWKAQNSGITNELDGVTWGNNQFVAVGGWFGNFSTLLTSPNGITWTPQNSGGTDQLYNVIWAGTQYVAVGLPNTILTSPDGVNWTTRTTTTNGLRSVAWNGSSQLVAVGNGGIVYTSPDGTSWTKQTSAVSSALFYVTWTGTQFVAVGTSGNIVTSTNGSSWTKQTSGTTKQLFGVASNPTGNRLVVVGDTGVILTSPTGTSWTLRSSGTTTPLNCVILSGSQFVAVGGDNNGVGNGKRNVVLTSPDSGISWVSQFSGAGTPLKSVAWNNVGNKFVAVGLQGQVLTSASDTTAPTISTSPQSQTVVGGAQVKLTTNVTAGATAPLIYTWLHSHGGSTDTLVKDTLSVLMDTLTLASISTADSGSYKVIVSNVGGSATSASAILNFPAVPNFSTWKAQNSGNSNELYAVTWGNNQFMAVGGGFGSNSTLLTSPDGITWTERNSGGVDQLYNAVWTGTQYVVVGLAGPSNGAILTSPDGITWTSRTNTAHALRSVVWTGSLLVAVGNSGNIITSPTGVTWTTRTSPVSNELAFVTWTGSLLVAVGSTGNIVTSSDGITWTKRTSGTTNLLLGVAWTGNQLVAIGQGGVVLTSPTGTTWTARTSGTSTALEGMLWTGSQLVAVGGDDNGTGNAGSGALNVISTSPDGVTWTSQVSGTGTPLHSIASDGSKFVAVGLRGVILTSAQDTIAPTISSSPQGLTTVVGTQVRLSVSATAGATVPLVYAWLHSHGGSTDTLKKDTVSVLQDTLTLASVSQSDTGSYKAVVSNIGGHATSASAALIINVAPSVNIQPHDTTVVSGLPASFTVSASGSGTLSYQWMKNGSTLSNGGTVSGATSSLLNISAVAITDTASYTVVVTNTLNSTTSTTISNVGKLMVNVAPSIATQPHDTTVISGANASFTVVAAAGPGSMGGTLSYQWMKNGANIVTGGTSATLSLTAVAITDTASYTVAVTRALNTTTTTTVSTIGKLIVNAAPGIATQPHDTTVALGANASFTVVAASGPGSMGGALSYQWKKNGSNIVTGGTSATLSLTAVAVADTGSYTVAVTRALNATTTTTISSAGKLIINVGPSFSTQPHDTTVLVGANASFTVSASGSGTLSYQWKKNGANILTGGTSAILSLTTVAITDTGLYTVAVTNTLNGTPATTTSNVGKLIVNVAPSIATQPHDTTVASNSNASFAVVAASGPASMGGTLSYQWMKNGANIVTGGTSATLSLTAVAIADTGSYTVAVTRALNATTTTTTSNAGKLIVNVGPSITIQPHDTTVLVGANASFTVSASGSGTLSYQWKKNGANILTGGTSAILSLTTVAITDTGLYTVSVTNTLNGTPATTTSNVGKLMVNVAPSIATQPHDTTVASGSNASFTVVAASGPGSMGGTLSYQWMKNGTNVVTGGTSATLSLTAASISDTGAYTVAVTRALNSTTTTTISNAGKLIINLGPSFSTQPRDTTVLVGANASFTVSATGSGILSYQWKKDGSNIVTGGNLATLSLTAVAIMDTGLYTVAVTNTLNGTPATTTSNVGKLMVNVAPSIATQPHDTTVASGSNASFTVVAASGPGSMGGTLSYQWMKNGTNVVTGGTSATLSLAAASISDTGAYTVAVTRALNSTTTTTVSTAGKLIINVVPSISIQPHDSTVVSGSAASFTVSASGSGALSYQWLKNGTNVVSGGASATFSLGTVAITDTGSYAVVVANTLNGTTTTTISNVGRLTVNVAPVIATQPRDTTVVSGSAVNFAVVAASGPGSMGGTLFYQWKKNGTNVVTGGTSAILSLTAVTIGDTGSYTAVVTRALNGTTTATTSNAGRLIVNVVPSITIQPHDTTVVSGLAASFTVSASGSGTLSYQWLKNGTNIVAGGNLATFSLGAAAVADTGSYAVVVANTLNGTTTTTTSNAGKLTVNVGSSFTTQPRDTTVLVGANASFAVAATGSGTLSYQWKKNGVNIVTGGTSATLFLAAVAITDTGSYSVGVTNTLNGIPATTASNIGKLMVNVAPAIAAQPRDTTVASGMNASFTVVAAAGPGSMGGALSYQWKKNGTNIVTGGTSAILSLTAVAIADTGSYAVAVTRTLNGTTTSTLSSAGKLTVNTAPGIATQPHDTTVLIGANASFTVSASGSGALSYQWLKNGINIVTGGTLATFSLGTAAITDTGSYAVVVANTLNGTTTTTSSNVGRLMVNVAPGILTQPHDTTVVSGSAASFTVVAAAGPGSMGGTLSYQWMKNGTNIVTSGTSSNYSIAATAAADTGSYSVVVTRTLNGTTTATTSRTIRLIVNVPPAITSQPQNKTVDVAGVTVKFGLSLATTGTVPFVYTWVHVHGASQDTLKRDTLSVFTDTLTRTLVGLADTGSYKVVVMNAGGVVTSTSAALLINLPAIASQLQPRLANLGGAVKFNIAVTGTAPFVYKWLHAHGASVDTLRRDTTAALSDTLTLASVVATDTVGSYKCVVANLASSVISDSVTLGLNVLATISVQPASLSRIVSGNTVFFAVTVSSGTAPFTYKWIQNGTDTISTTTATTALTDTLLIAASVGSNYKCLIINAAGSVTSNVASLTVTTPILAGHAKIVFGILTLGSSIQFRLPPEAASARLSITDMGGSNVWSHTLGSGLRELTWNGSSTSRGIYWVRMELRDAQQRPIGLLQKRIVFIH